MSKIVKIFNSFKEWWSNLSRRTKIIFFVALVLVIIFSLKGDNSDDGSVIETVKRQTLSSTVSASGTVVSSTDLSLGFEQSKVVQSISVKVGDKVRKGQILATLSNGTERATLLSAKAKYNKVLEGSSNEEINLATVNLQSTTKTQDGLVEDARKKMLSADLVATSDGITSANSPIISGVYSGPEGTYSISFQTGGSDSYVTFSGIESGTTPINSYTTNPLGKYGLFIKMPTGASASGGNTWTVKIPNKSGASYATNLGAYESAKNTRDQAIAIAQAELDLKTAKARNSDVESAYADVAIAEANLEKTILRAPADGTVTLVDIKYGELATVGKTAIAIQDINNLYIEANINENNIKDIQVGQSIAVTFDAFPGEEYKAEVSSIDPASTNTNNVVNYKIKALISDKTNIRPGMTANMTILTSIVNDVLVISGRNINTNDGKSEVAVIVDEDKMKTVSKSVEVGLRGDGDMVEIKSGLNVGDKVLWIPKK